MGERKGMGGALVGLMATLALSGWLYLAHAWWRLPFIPFDIADAMIRLTPGSIATAGIEALGEGAKRLLLVTGLLITVGAGAGLSGFAAQLLERRQARRGPPDGMAGRLVWAALVFAALALTCLIEVVIGWNSAPVLRSLIGLGASYAAWAWVVLVGLNAPARPTVLAETADSAQPAEPPGLGISAERQAESGVPGRRRFLLRFAGASLGTALMGFGLGEILRRSQVVDASALPPLPTPVATPAAATETAGAPQTLSSALVAPAPAASPLATADTAGTAVTATPSSAAEATPASGAGPALVAGQNRAPTPTLPPPAADLPPPGTPLAAFDPAPGTRPNLTPLEDFYVVNIATRDPLSDLSQWRLRVHGLVDHQLSLGYADLLRLPRVDVYVTLACISNPVGGKLISTAQFNGARLHDVLNLAGVGSEAVEVVTRSLDGYTESVPVEKALREDTLLVYGMNGLTLAQEHGYPVRLYNPNHYGMKNPKWLTDLELVSAPYQGYWEFRGWDKEAVVKTATVLDTRGQLSSAHGIVTLGGIAFAGWRSIDKVMVSVDRGEGREATLDRPLSPFTWVRWRYDWRDATSGPHDIAVWSVDGTGEEQTNFVTPPHPDGASGWHKVHVVVEK